MKRPNTNGLAGGEKGWHLATSCGVVGVQEGYDPSTYERVLDGLTAKQEDAIIKAIGEEIWDSKEEAVEAVKWEAGCLHCPHEHESPCSLQFSDKPCPPHGPDKTECTCSMCKDPARLHRYCMEHPEELLKLVKPVELEFVGTFGAGGRLPGEPAEDGGGQLLFGF